jgi:hypothetical protein
VLHLLARHEVVAAAPKLTGRAKAEALEHALFTAMGLDEDDGSLFFETLTALASQLGNDVKRAWLEFGLSAARTIKEEWSRALALSVHDKYCARVLGYDNAHAVKPPKAFKFAGYRLSHDRHRRTSRDKGVPYGFETKHRLLEDLFAEVDRVIK